MLRVYFRYDRRLPGKLCRVAARVINESIRALTGRPECVPEIIICVHAYGNFAHHHPRGHSFGQGGPPHMGPLRGLI
jgi:hypothetical protein